MDFIKIWFSQTSIMSLINRNCTLRRYIIITNGITWRVTGLDVVIVHLQRGIVSISVETDHMICIVVHFNAYISDWIIDSAQIVYDEYVSLQLQQDNNKNNIFLLYKSQ